MPLSFLVPAFLAGLAALAVPVAIHLTRRQTRRPQEFPSLMFLARIPHESTSRRRIHRWPLLLLRCAALALLVFAFARPFVETSAAGPLAIGGSDREVVILLDRSYSMGYGGLWANAVQAAREVLDGLGSSDRATLVLFDTGAEVIEESTADAAALRAALARAEPGPRGTRYAPALQYAQRVLSGSPLGQREVALISDFQRNAWDSEAGIMSTVRLPAGTVVNPIRVSGGSEINVTVASVSFQRSHAAGYERVAATARLTSHLAAAGTTVPVTLAIDGRVVETRAVDLESNGTATVRFPQITLPETGTARGTVRIPEDALPADNEFHFVLSSERPIGVLVLSTGGSATDGRLFIERALTIGEAPAFRVTSKRVEDLQPADLASASVVVLNQAAFPGGEVGQRLRRHVEEGGGLVLVMGGERSSGWETLFGSRAGSAVDHARAGGTALGFVDLGHPIFVPFSSPRSGDFTSARVFRYRELPDAGSHRVLARFGDGGAALVEAQLGTGRALAWTSGFDARSTDLPLQPVFLPFLHQVVKHAAGYTPARTWLEVGDPLGAAAAQRRGGEPYRLLVGPDGDRTPIEQATAIALDRPGFYELRGSGSAVDGTPLAVNVDRSESEVESFDPRELVAALTLDGEVSPLANVGGASLTTSEREERQSAWRYLLIVAFAMLALETLLSNRSRRSTSAAAPRSAPGGSRPAGVR